MANIAATNIPDRVNCWRINPELNERPVEYRESQKKEKSGVFIFRKLIELHDSNFINSSKSSSQD